MTNFAASKQDCHEENISAIQQEKKEQARFQGEDVFSKRAPYHFRKKKEGAKEVVGL
jgi:hypothetical protein